MVFLLVVRGRQQTAVIVNLAAVVEGTHDVEQREVDDFFIGDDGGAGCVFVAVRQLLAMLPPRRVRLQLLSVDLRQVQAEGPRYRVVLPLEEGLRG